MYACVTFIIYIKNLIQDVTSDKYAVMYYGKHNSIGIRRKFEKKNQIFSFGGRTCGLSESVLRGFGDDCLKKFNEGESEASVKKWVLEAIKQDP